MHFIKSLEEVYQVIDRASLLTEHGGEREHDSVEWVRQQISREASKDFGSLSDCMQEL